MNRIWPRRKWSFTKRWKGVQVRNGTPIYVWSGFTPKWLFLFPNMKKWLGGKTFGSNQEKSLKKCIFCGRQHTLLWARPLARNFSWSEFETFQYGYRKVNILWERKEPIEGYDGIWCLSSKSLLLCCGVC